MRYYIGHSVLVPSVGMPLIEKDCGCSICDKTPFRELKSASTIPRGKSLSATRYTYQFSIAPWLYHLRQLTILQNNIQGRGRHIIGYFVSSCELVCPGKIRTGNSRIHGPPEDQP